MRFALIVLVVLGHMIMTMRSAPAIDVAYTWIYTFHMPAFVFLSGLVVRRSAVDERQGARIIGGFVAPLVIFTVLYEAVARLIGQPAPSDSSLADPYWLLWFLAALALWRLSVPLLRALRWPVATSAVIAAGLALLVDLPSEASIDRFIVLTPFFTAGLMLTPDRLRVLRSRTVRLLAAGFLAVSIPLAVRTAHALPDRFILFNDGVERLADLPEFLGMYALATGMIIALLALVPAVRGAFTVWGSRTVYVYLLHGFAVLAFRASPLDDLLNNPTGWIVVAVASAGLAVGLSSEPVVRATRRFVEPDLSWLLRRADAGPRTA